MGGISSGWARGGAGGPLGPRMGAVTLREPSLQPARPNPSAPLPTYPQSRSPTLSLAVIYKHQELDGFSKEPRGGGTPVLQASMSAQQRGREAASSYSPPSGEMEKLLKRPV